MVSILIVLCFFGIIAASIASAKGRSALGWFILGLAFGPFALAVALLPSLKAADHLSVLATQNLRACPECAEMVQKEARKCRFCGSALEPLPPPPPAPPEYRTGLGKAIK